jgi:hypothetical protein
MSCQKDEVTEPNTVIETTPNTFRVNNNTFEGYWYFDFETSGIVNGHLVRPVMIIKLLPNARMLVGGDTVDVINNNTYIGASVFNQLTSGTLNGSSLHHCELYADSTTQTSRYICVTYSRSL